MKWNFTYCAVFSSEIGAFFISPKVMAKTCSILKKIYCIFAVYQQKICIQLGTRLGFDWNKDVDILPRDNIPMASAERETWRIFGNLAMEV